jgi:hypothetical protein
LGVSNTTAFITPFGACFPRCRSHALTQEIDFTEEIDLAEEVDFTEEVDLPQEVDFAEEVDFTEEVDLSEEVDLAKEVDLLRQPQEISSGANLVQANVIPVVEADQRELRAPSRLISGEFEFQAIADDTVAASTRATSIPVGGWRPSGNGRPLQNLFAAGYPWIYAVVPGTKGSYQAVRYGSVPRDVGVIDVSLRLGFTAPEKSAWG